MVLDGVLVVSKLLDLAKEGKINACFLKLISKGLMIQSA
jgi:hypothetical protein